MTSILSVLSGPVVAQTCRSESTPPADSEVVTLKAVGDIVLGSDWPVAYYPPGFEEAAQARLAQVLGNADIVFGNMEGVLTTHNVSTKKVRPGFVFAFRMPPRFASLLKGAGFSVMNVANNHTFDFGPRGYEDTITHLTAAGILPFGEKDRFSLQKIKDVTLAWIGFSYFDRHNSMRDFGSLAELIGRARREADLVIVSTHAGAEGSEALRVFDREEIFLGENRGNVFAFAHRAVDLGADLVLAHGPHVLRGMECYKGKLIAYSLGNFAGYGAFSTKRAAAISAVLEVKLAKNRQTLGFDLIPLKFDDDRLPEIDPANLARYLVNDLSGRPPLEGTVHLPTDSAGLASYREWLSASGLVDIVNDRRGKGGQRRK